MIGFTKIIASFFPERNLFFEFIIIYVCENIFPPLSHDNLTNGDALTRIPEIIDIRNRRLLKKKIILLM